MRRQSAPLIRLVCALMLLVAAWPMEALARGAVGNADRTDSMAACNMPCCKPMASNDQPTLKAPPCGCEVKSAPVHPSPGDVTATLSGTFAFPFLPIERPLWEIPGAVLVDEPGTFASDSSPPPIGIRSLSRGRAPPFVRG